MNTITPHPLTKALTGLQRQLDNMAEDAAAMTPDNPNGFEKPLLSLHQHGMAARVELKVIKTWNENLGCLLDILA